MKKTILGLAFLTIASFSFSAVAQNQADNQSKSNTECVSKDKCNKQGKKCKKGDKEGGFKGEFKGQKPPKANPFEGLNLTTEQQGKIEALNNARKTSRKEIKEKAREARENRDTTFNPRKATQELRSKYVKDLGEILTTDQMTVFLTNYYVNHGGNGKEMMGNQPGGPRFDKGHRPGNGPEDGKGPCDGRGPCDGKEYKGESNTNSDTASL